MTIRRAVRYSGLVGEVVDLIPRNDEFDVATKMLVTAGWGDPDGCSYAHPLRAIRSPNGKLVGALCRDCDTCVWGNPA